MLVLTTEASLEKAERLANALLDRGLVACVSLIPILSLYQWQGRATRSEEVQLLLKTHEPCLGELHQTLMALHSYETPEWITLQAQTAGAYGQWCAEQLKADSVMEDDAPPDHSRSSEDEGPTG